MKEKRLHKPFPEIFKELARLAGKEDYEYEKADNSLEKIGDNIIISDINNDYRMSICYNDENEIKEIHYMTKNKNKVRFTMSTNDTFKKLAELSGIKNYNFNMSKIKTYKLRMKQEQLVSEICNDEQAYRIISVYNDMGNCELHCFIER